MSAKGKESIPAFADAILRGEYPFLGYGTVNLGSNPDWNLDFVSGKSWPQILGDQITVVRHDGSDVKVPWELSRLQFLPVLGKAFVLTREAKYRDRAKALLTNWMEGNPVGKGVNWTIAMEAALRAMSICFLLELLWPFQAEEQPWLQQATASLWKHLLYIESHNEFSHLVRSNHYLSNIVGLFVLSSSLEGRGMAARRRKYARKVEGEILKQTYADGGDYEASAGYHLLVTQMFTSCLLVMRARKFPLEPNFFQRLAAMYDWMAALADRRGRLPHIGDCDDGRVELTSDDLSQMLLPVAERDSLHVGSQLGVGAALFDRPFPGSGEDAAWYGLKLPLARPAESAGDAVRVFPDSGIAVVRRGQAQAVFCALPNGIGGRGSHTHNDKLSFILRLGEHELFSDSGTGGYTRNSQTRNHFRSSASHNVATVDGQEQNSLPEDPRELFRLGNEAAVTPIQRETDDAGVTLRASHSGYQRLAVEHRRSLTLRSGLAVVEDRFKTEVERRFDLFFQLSSLWKVEVIQGTGNEVSCNIRGPQPVSMTCSAPVELTLSQGISSMSRAYGAVSPSLRIRIQAKAKAPFTIVSTICWG